MGIPPDHRPLPCPQGTQVQPNDFSDLDYASGSLAEQGDNLVFARTAFGADTFWDATMAHNAKENGNSKPRTTSLPACS